MTSEDSSDENASVSFEVPPLAYGVIPEYSTPDEDSDERYIDAELD